MPVYFFISAFLSLSPSPSVFLGLLHSLIRSLFLFCPPTLCLTLFDPFSLSVVVFFFCFMYCMYEVEIAPRLQFVLPVLNSFRGAGSRGL